MEQTPVSGRRFKEMLTKELRQWRGRAQQIATTLGIPKTTLSSWANENRSALPDVESAYELSVALHVDLVYLVTGHQPEVILPEHLRIIDETLKLLGDRPSKLFVQLFEALGDGQRYGVGPPAHTEVHEDAPGYGETGVPVPVLDWSPGGGPLATDRWPERWRRIELHGGESPASHYLMRVSPADAGAPHGSLALVRRESGAALGTIVVAYTAGEGVALTRLERRPTPAGMQIQGVFERWVADEGE